MKRGPGDHFRSDWLVLRCREGDAAAFELLVGLWQERLWRHARRLTGDEDAAYDILQEAWLAIVRGLDRIRDPAAFPAWAYRVVTNKSNDWVRRESRRRAGIQSYVKTRAAEQRTEVSQPDDRCENLKDALARLPSSDLALLSLKYEEDFDSSQIAEALGVAEGTVRSRLFYLRRRIRIMIEEKKS